MGNQWDNGTIGNFWGEDYIIKYPDAKRAGIVWDTSYEINGDGLGIDNFPLVNSITPKQKISGFPLVNILFFISVGIYIVKRRK